MTNSKEQFYVAVFGLAAAAAIAGWFQATVNHEKFWEARKEHIACLEQNEKNWEQNLKVAHFAFKVADAMLEAEDNNE